MNKIKKWLKENCITIFILILIYFIFNYELPFYILAPGGTIDISDRVNVDTRNKVNGNLYLMYATEIKATIPTYLITKFSNKWDLFDNGERQISNESREEIELRNKIMLNNSIDTAIYVAYTHANKQIKITGETHYILGITEESTCDFKIGDKILKANGSTIEHSKEINDIVSSSNYNDTINFVINRDGTNKDASCKVGKDGKIGVVVVTDYDYDLEPAITLKFKQSESGSSGGMMLTLSIYENITSEDLIKGKSIAGTGTIEKDGTIGEIGGVKYKIIGASKKNIDIIFVPEENYEEAIQVKNEYNYNMKIIKVHTFDEVINYLKNN